MLMQLAGGLAKGVAKGLVKKPKISAAKFAGKVEDTKAKATAAPKGSLVPSPGGSIVKVVDVKPDSEKKIKGEGGDPLIREVSIIYQRTIDIQKALRNEQKAKKKRAKAKLKADQKKKRNLKERLSELAGGAGKAVMGAASKAMSPATGFFNNLLQGISMIFMGWLSRYLPQILGFAERIVNAISTVGKFLSPIIGFVWDALKWIVGTGANWIAKLTGTPSDEADNKTILGNIAAIQKKIPLIEAAFAAFIIGDMINIITGALDFVQEHKKTIKRTLRKVYRKLPRPVRNVVRKVTKNLRPANLMKKVKSIKPVQTAKNLAKRVTNIKPKQAIQNLAKKIKLPKPTGGGGWLSGIRSNLGKGWQATKSAAVKVGKGAWGLSKKALQGINDYAAKQLDNLGGMWKGAKEWGAKQATKLGDIAELAKNPKKLADLMKSKLTSSIDDIVKKNKTLKNLLTLAKDPKKIGGAIRGVLEGAKKSQGILDVKAALNRAKAAKVGGVDKIIAAVMALIDYMVLKESPINAIVKAVSGMLGYAAGFAIGAPFGGMPGFITGMAGGALGELAGYGLLKGLVKVAPGLTEVTDPIMGAGPKGDGRPILRDPDGPMDHMVDKNLKITKENSKSTNDKNNDANSISESASYDQPGGVDSAAHGEGSIIPVPVGEMKSSSSSAVNGSSTASSTLNKHEVAKTNQKTKELAILYKD